jgi:hypothetical protein
MPFTKTFDTTAGQLLYVKTLTEEQDYAIRVQGEDINGITPAAILSYEQDEQARDDAFDKITQEAAETTAQSFVQLLQGSISGAPDLD